jgi:lipopolysaccharide export LptBFGC system permease protein LptF
MVASDRWSTVLVSHVLCLCFSYQSARQKITGAILMMAVLTLVIFIFVVIPELLRRKRERQGQ